MYIDKTLELFEKVVKTQTPLSFLMWGATGIGKTSSMEQFAELIKYRLINLRLSQKESVDILGVPYTGTVEIQGKSYGVTNHHPPEWFVRALIEGDVVLFLDELNRATKETLQAAFELVLERSINGKKLSNNVFIVAACNPSNTSSYDTIELDDALIGRFVHLHIQPSVSAWKNWAVKPNKRTGKPNINTRVLNFISLNEDCLNELSDEDKKFPLTDFQLRPHSRSWEFVSMLEDLGLHDNDLEECVRGTVGLEKSLKYMASRRYMETPISLEEIFILNLQEESDLTTKFKMFLGEIPTERDGEQLTIVRSDAFNQTNEEIFLKEKDIRSSKEKVEKVLDYVDLLPAALGYSLLSKLYDLADDKEEVWAEAILSRPNMVEKFKEMSLVQIENKIVKVN